MAIRNFYLPKRMGKRRRAEEDRDISTTLVPLAADLPTWLLFFKYIQRRSTRRLSSEAGRNQKQKEFSFSLLCEFFFVKTVFLILVLITTLLSIRSVVIMSVVSAFTSTITIHFDAPLVQAPMPSSQHSWMYSHTFVAVFNNILVGKMHYKL